MKTRINAAILTALWSVALDVHAQPNAWQVNDNSFSDFVGYTNILSTGARMTAATNGFDFSVNARFVTDYNAGNRTMVMIYGDGTTRWEILWSLNASGDLVSELFGDGNKTYTVTTNGTGRALYHTHEITYNSAIAKASYLVDGQVVATNWAGSTLAWTNGQIEWGAGSSTGVGAMNFHSVSFIVTNGVVASYDASNSPAIAPDPKTKGWGLSPAAPPSDTSTNAISPDRGPDVVTTLADNGAGSLRQTIAEALSGDTITFFTNGVITLTNGELLITKNLTMTGPGSANLAIDGNHASRVLEISNANVTIDSLTLTNGYVGSTDTSAGGAGIIVDSTATVTLNNCTLSGNKTLDIGWGGGVNNEGTLSLNNCTLSANHGDGGGIFSYGTLTAHNCTFSGNSTYLTGNGGGIGGAIYIASGNTTLNNCTLVGNSAGGEGGGIYIQGSISTAFALTNTIIAGNTRFGHPDNIAGPFSGANNLINGDPQLAPLGNYGGPTQTMPPLAGSAAIDAGLDTITNTLTTDQRGYLRKSGTHVDIGAVEVQQSVVVNANDSGAGSLRAAIAAVPELVTFANTLSGQAIHLTSGQLTLSSSVGIDASALASHVIIDAGGNYRIMEITASNAVTLDSLTLTNGHATGDGGGILLDSGAALTINNSTLAGNSATNSGGGLFNNNGTLAVTNCAFAGNSCGAFGGGLHNLGTFTIDNSTFFDNFAGIEGGGIYNQVAATVNNCILSGNVAASNGGGIDNEIGALAVKNSNVSANSAASNGGGIDNGNGGTVAVTNSTLSGNSASFGGGILSYNGTLTINNSILSGNTATNSGGGINVNDGTNTLSNCTISGNIAGAGGGISSDGGMFTVNNSTLSGNFSYNEGGGIRNYATLTVNRSTLSGNSANYVGGGIGNYATLFVNDSTLFGNTANLAGGGIFTGNDECDFCTMLTVNNSTITGNSSGGGGGIYQASNAGMSVFTNTIVAGNTANNIAGSFDLLSVVSSITSGNPLLASLGNYGGLTQTMPPTAGSPAIDAGLDAVTNSLPTDQRGYARKSGAHVDVGAVEAQFAPTNNRPRLKNFVVQGNGALSFNFTNIPNADFTVLASTNVAAPVNQWTPLGWALQSLPGQYQFTDPGATNYPKRFYRVSSP